MFGLFGGPQRRLVRTFTTAFNTAHHSPDPNKRLSAAEKALEIAIQIDPWPWEDPAKEEAICQLQCIEGQVHWELMRHDPVRHSECALASFEKAARYLTRDDVEQWAFLLMNTALVYADRPTGDKGADVEKAIGLLEEVLRIVDHRSHRETWIASMVNMASCYGRRASGNREKNLERSIQTLEKVLAILSGEREPMQWAQVHSGLGAAYKQLQNNRSENLETAIKHMEEALTVLSFEHTPYEWAGTTMNLSSAYSNRVQGQRAENIQRALETSDLSLRVFTRDDTPSDWASVQLNRGVLFMERPTGDSLLNCEEAINAFEQALSVFTPEDFPHEYASVMRNLALAKSGRIAGSKKENVESSIHDARIAAAAVNKETMPLAWAGAQVTLATTLAATRDGKKSENLEEAIALFRAALTVLTPTSELHDWTVTMGQLANALAERVEGNHGDNIERAIEVQEEALRFINQDNNPRSWGSALQNLAVSYEARVVGLRADNVERQIALVELALVVINDRNYPQQCSSLLEVIGDAFPNRVRGVRLDNLDRALQAYDAAASMRRPDGDLEVWLRLRQKRLQVLLDRQQVSPRKDKAEASKVSNSTSVDGEEFISKLRDSILVTPEDSPRVWAAAQVNIGDLYIQNAPSGVSSRLNDLIDRARRNAFKALEAYEAALSVTDCSHHPIYWSGIKRCIARAYTLLHMYGRVPEVSGKLEKPIDLQRGAEEPALFLEAAIAALEASLEFETLETAPRTYLKSMVSMGQLQIWNGDWASAEASFLSAAKAADQILADVELTDSEMKDTLKALGELATLSPFTALVLGHVENALALMESGRSRLLAKALALEGLTLPAETRQELQGLYRDLAAAENHLASPFLFYRSGPLDKSIQLRNRIREVIEQVDLETLTRRNNVCDLAADLAAEGSVIVIPVLTYHGGKLIVALSRDGAMALHVVDCGDNADAVLSSMLEGRIGDLTGGWRDRYHAHKNKPLENQELWSRTLEKTGQVVGDIFAGPLMNALELLGVKPGVHLLLLPQGPLGFFPLAIARNPTSGETLIERYELSLSPGLAPLSHTRLRSKSVPDSIAAISNPQNNLSFADFETELANSWFASNSSPVLSGSNCTLANTLKTLRGRSIWHFACHGNFDLTLPLNSGLDLAGKERLTLRDLFETRGLGQPRLVILSACETGLYDLTELPHEFIGLPTGFLQAGATGVIATLWPVWDISTTLLLGRFYDEYLGRHLSPSTALRTAQLWLRDASREGLRSSITEWRRAGRVSHENATTILRELDTAWSARDGPPFAAPVFWSGFVHYGH